MSAVRVLIADDHPLFRDGMHGLLDPVQGTEVVGEASDGEEAVRLAGELSTDVILMDLNMPGKNGIEATREILAAQPETGILVVTMLEDDDSVFAAMRAGALGYLLKGARQEEVLRAIRAVANGEAIFGPGIARRVMGLFSAQKPKPPQAFPELTEREEEIVGPIAAGHDNAARLLLSLKTVQDHVSNIFRKLRVADHVRAALRAREAGLGGWAEAQVNAALIGTRPGAFSGRVLLCGVTTARGRNRPARPPASTNGPPDDRRGDSW